MATASVPCRPAAEQAAWAAAALFGLHLVTYFVPSIRGATLATGSVVAAPLAVLAVAQHLVVFPVVAALPAPRWSRAAAYTWLPLDMLTDLAQLVGAPQSLYLPVRLAVNILAAAWIASASWTAPGTVRGIGLFVALDTAAYSCLGLFFPWAFLIALPSLILLPVWFGLMARRLAAHRRTVLP
ncbi:hypothetical protein [Sinomonas sp.]|uniref:hypothetical protein n=1 Tax=Sinomonas sp. TaxID=1914986 RepID=UPI002FE33DF6